ncbi:MAG: choice-of-anchor J domain-containing protein, partial [Prevotella sp.]|nr:choice-of-anchor J domain-containing protein [Prevotella sp.]
MKKFIYSMFVLAVSAFTFTSCEDVPAPYAQPGHEEVDPNGESVFNLPYNSASCNDWTVKTVKGTDWSLGNSYAKASGYSNNVTTETETWLVSPVIKTTSSTGVIINLEHVIRYTRSNNDLEKHKLLVSDNYNGDVSAATWKQLAYKPVASSTNSWDFYESNTIQLPDEYLNKDVVFAFKFECGSDNSTTWEVKNVEIKEGTGGDLNPDVPPTETIGSAENPITTTEAFTRIEALGNGEKTSEFAYVKGKIVKVLTNADNFAKYGNINYYISDDGTTTNQVQVYAGDGLNGEKFKAVTDIKAGDEVVVFGHLYKYVNNNTGAVTPEISESYLVKLTPGSGGGGETGGEAKGSGTKDDPYNPVAAVNFTKSLGADAESSDDVYVKGKISSIKYTYNAQYGTATYNISEDGSTTNEFTVYGSYYFNKQSWKEGDTQIKVGDDVVVCGKVVYFQGNTPEFANKKNWLVSLNGKTEGGSGGGNEG